MNKRRFEYYRAFTGWISLFTGLLMLITAFSSEGIKQTAAVGLCAASLGMVCSAYLLKRTGFYYASYILTTLCSCTYACVGNNSVSVLILLSLLLLCLGFAAPHAMTAVLQCTLCIVCVLHNVEMLLPMATVTVGVIVADYIIDKVFDDYTTLYNKYKQAAYKDVLTGCYNRLQLEAALPALQSDYSVVLIDIDFFKQCNDTYGHAYGDEVLQKVSAHLMKVFGADNVCRYGGEEFLILLNKTSKDDVLKLSEECRSTMQDAASVSISVGVTCALPNENPTDVIARADAALYEAKESGRNKVIFKED